MITTFERYEKETEHGIEAINVVTVDSEVAVYYSTDGEETGIQIYDLEDFSSRTRQGQWEYEGYSLVSTETGDTRS